MACYAYAYFTALIASYKLIRSIFLLVGARLSKSINTVSFAGDLEMLSLVNKNIQSLASLLLNAWGENEFSLSVCHATSGW